MNILFTAPFWSREINSIAQVPLYLGSQGNSVLIVTAQNADSLKGKVSAPELEHFDGCEFYRPYLHTNDLTWRPQTQFARIKEKCKIFRPDVIVGFGDSFFRLPLQLSKDLNVPLVMFFEYLRLDKFSLPIRGGGRIKTHLPVIYKSLSGIFRRYLIDQCSAVMFSYFGDRDELSKIKKYCPIVQYVPWCTEIEESASELPKERNTGIYIGSLDAFKNAGELVKALPLILMESDCERFTVVGPGEYAPEVRRLVKRFGNRLCYIESMPRSAAISLLHSTGFGYTPVTDCGLGFIGDCWATRTPLIATHDLDGFLNRGHDALIANGVGDLSITINSLLNSNEIFLNLQRNGHQRYLVNYTAQAVGDEYEKVLAKAIEISAA